MPRFPQSALARRRRFRAVFLAVTVAVVAVLFTTRKNSHSKPVPLAAVPTTVAPGPSATAPAAHVGLATPSSYAPGVPANHDPNNLYYYDSAGLLSPTVANDPPRIYVPNTMSNTVSVIDPTTYQVIRTIPVGDEPQHVSPSWDLKTLWVANDKGNSLTPINPTTGYVRAPVP